MRKAIFTKVYQYDVLVLDEKDWPEGYGYNRPNNKWELVEYVGMTDKDGEPRRAWVAGYSLKTPKILDFTKVEIKEK